MKHIKIKLSVLLLSMGLAAQAQKATITSNGDITGSGGRVSYSVGQVFYTTNSSASGTVSHGVQQSHEIFTLDVKEAKINVSISVFPNPTADNLTLQQRKIVLSAVQYTGEIIR